jgi:hypothetical protein
MHATPLLAVDGYALPVTVRLHGEHVIWQEASSLTSAPDHS